MIRCLRRNFSAHKDHAVAEKMINFWLHEVQGIQDINLVKQHLTSNFKPYVERLAADEIEHWKAETRLRLAYVLCASDFSKGIYQGTPQAHGLLDRAVEATREILPTLKYDEYKVAEKLYMLMPFLHTEKQEDLFQFIHEAEILVKTSKKLPNPEYAFQMIELLVD